MGALRLGEPAVPGARRVRIRTLPVAGARRRPDAGSGALGLHAGERRDRRRADEPDPRGDRRRPRQAQAVRVRVLLAHRHRSRTPLVRRALATRRRRVCPRPLRDRGGGHGAFGGLQQRDAARPRRAANDGPPVGARLGDGVRGRLRGARVGLRDVGACADASARPRPCPVRAAAKRRPDLGALACDLSAAVLPLHARHSGASRRAVGGGAQRLGPPRPRPHGTPASSATSAASCSRACSTRTGFPRS